MLGPRVNGSNYVRAGPMPKKDDSISTASMMKRLYVNIKNKSSPSNKERRVWIRCMSKGCHHPMLYDKHSIVTKRKQCHQSERKSRGSRGWAGIEEENMSATQ